MIEWDGNERRSGQGNIYERMSEIQSSIQVLATKLDNLADMKKRHDEEFRKVLEKHDADLNGNGHDGLKVKIGGIKEIKDEMVSHTATDRYMFGAIITMLLFVLGKLFLK